MATERLPMRTIREILRLKWSLSRSHRETARSLGISAGAVASVVTRAAGLGLTWPTVEPLTEDELDRRLYGPRLAGAGQPRGAGPGLDPHRTAPEGRDARAPAPGVSGRPSGRLPLLGLLRALPGVDASAAPVDAPGVQGRREDLRRLRRASSRTWSTPDDGRAHPRRALRRGARARRTTPTPRRRSASRAPTSSPATAARWNSSAACSAIIVPDQLRTGVGRPVPLRTGPAAHVRRVGAALRHGHHSRAPPGPSGQGEGRGGGARRRALDPGAAAPRGLPHAGRAERPHPRAADVAQRPPDAQLRRAVAPGALRALRPSGAPPAAHDALRTRRLAPGPRQHRLPHRRRAPLLLGARTNCLANNSTSASPRR